MANVFISSTGKDLTAYRQAAIEVCLKLRLFPIAMEFFEAMGIGATEGSKSKLDDADVYVGIFAHRYGYIEDGHDKSVTEIEFDYAGDKKLKRLGFLLDPKHPWPQDAIDFENHKRLEKFKARINKLIRARFTTVDNFKAELMHALFGWKEWYDARSHVPLPEAIRADQRVPRQGDWLEDSFDVFLSHAHTDAETVAALGQKLEDEAHLRVWLDQWVLVSGEHWQQKMAKGLEQAQTCAVCIGQQTPDGWFREEIQRALNRQTKEHSFRVIPVILPQGNRTLVDSFLELRTWVDFESGLGNDYAFRVLVSGIKGVSPGRITYEQSHEDVGLNTTRKKLATIRTLRAEQLIDEGITLEYQRRFLDKLIEP